MHTDYLFQMAAPRRVLRDSLTPFWPGSPQYVPLKSLLRVTLENPKRMGRGGSEARWTEARKVRAGGIVFRARCLGSEQVFRAGWGGEAALVAPALALLSGQGLVLDEWALGPWLRGLSGLRAVLPPCRLDD